MNLNGERIAGLGLEESAAKAMAKRINELSSSLTPAELWRVISKELLIPEYPFELHLYLYDSVFADWDLKTGPPPAWSPTDEFITTTNIAKAMKELKIISFDEFFRWSVEHREAFWDFMIKKINIRFKESPSEILDRSSPVESPRWLADAKLNIVDSCFQAPEDSIAIIAQSENGNLFTTTYGELEALTNRVANGIVKTGFSPGDSLAICMPMTVECVAIYLGIIKAGCVAVSIADSFAPDAIALRNEIANVIGIFTQDFIYRDGKKLPLYEKIIKADAPSTVVLSVDDTAPRLSRDEDSDWNSFLSDADNFISIPRSPDDHSNILYSSGTTGEPKAIPWTQSTPIKCAVDGHLHQNIQTGDRLAWPTNLGWMMGPWLIYASLINQASMGLYYGIPTGKDFGKFIQDAEITMLGLVPSIVKAWKNSDSIKGIDWSKIKSFSSTGESSNAVDMLFLMSLAGYKPIIEYCGGTEIGGGYITGTMVQPSSPATFSTPALGLDVVILDENKGETDNGELFIVPPSIGLSRELLNRDHHEVYFEGTPKGKTRISLRRHGDQMERLGGGYFRAHGRVDDTMNLSGIKISSVEIERALNPIDGVSETAAISVSPPDGGPESLVIYTVLEPKVSIDKNSLKSQMQDTIKNHINPLFRIFDLVFTDALPRTASNKVMRRELRAGYKG